MTALAPVLQAFFTDRLIAQRHASGHTITGYRDTFRLLLGFATAKTGKKPSALDIADLDAPLIAAFLDHLEHDRHNTVRTRNWRLAAIHSLFGYAALHHPEHAAVIQRVLAIPAKRYERTLLTWLTEPEVDALLAAPDRGTWTGRRDHAHARARRPDRAADLRTDRPSTAATSTSAPARTCAASARAARNAPPRSPHSPSPSCAAGSPRHAGVRPHDPLFPTRTGARLSHDAIEHRLAVHLATARASLPVAARQARHHAHPAPHLRHAAADTPAPTSPSSRSGSATNRSATARHLPARRHGAEGTSHRQGHPARHRARPLPATRPAARLPRQPLIVPTCRQSMPCHATDPRSGRNNHDVGSIGVMGAFDPSAHALFRHGGSFPAWPRG